MPTKITQLHDARKAKRAHENARVVAKKLFDLSQCIVGDKLVHRPYAAVVALVSLTVERAYSSPPRSSSNPAVAVLILIGITSSLPLELIRPALIP